MRVSTIRRANRRPRSATRPVVLVGLVALLASVACAGPAPSPTAQSSDVKVTMTDFKYAAPATAFKVGVPYRFVVTNSGSVNHEFMVVSPQTAGQSSEDLDKLALGRIDDETFPPGSTQMVTVTFTKPQGAGTLEFACHVAGHYEQGMHIPITVSS
jgi:uncharacterized cupredoxin-like copper-binding protein